MYTCCTRAVVRTPRACIIMRVRAQHRTTRVMIVSVGKSFDLVETELYNISVHARAHIIHNPRPRNSLSRVFVIDSTMHTQTHANRVIKNDRYGPAIFVLPFFVYPVPGSVAHRVHGVACNARHNEVRSRAALRTNIRRAGSRPLVDHIYLFNTSAPRPDAR